MASAVVRLVFPDRIARCTLDHGLNADVSEIWLKTKAIVADSGRTFVIQSGNSMLPQSGISLAQLGIKNGHVLNVMYTSASQPSSQKSTSKSESANSRAPVVQQPVDDFLESLDGSVSRIRDSNFCKHGATGMCDYCAPLKPFDAKFIEESKIKHISFHSYLRKILSKSLIPGGVGLRAVGAPTSTYNDVVSHPLTPPFYSVDSNCTAGHPRWPEGICSRCQPSAISLNRQEFRMVDHVEFETSDVVNGLLSFWRSSGMQRAAFMYGRYVPYDGVPLGVKAVVCATYEPMQRNNIDGLSLLAIGHTDEQLTETGESDSSRANELEERKLAEAELREADEFAATCGLVRVGLIFTDLVDDGSGTGRVVYKRHEKSHFLTSHEVILAAHFQRQHPTPSRFSSTGVFGSRFITCVVSGNAQNGIEVEAYQVSESAVAMFDAGIITGSTKPAQMIVKSPKAPGLNSTAAFVPEVMYNETNEYGARLQRRANPDFPVDFLLVNVSHGFRTATTDNASFSVTTGVTSIANTFSVFKYPAANRHAEPQTHQSLSEFIASISSPTATAGTALDFNFLHHLCRSKVLSQEETRELCSVILAQNATTLLSECPQWLTLAQVLPPPHGLRTRGRDGFGGPMSSSAGPSAQSASWNCPHCTFINTSDMDCEMCGLPRS